MAKLAMLQLMQLVGARSMTRSPMNQETGAPPSPGFPHTMLSVKNVKDNMRLTFIEKLFTNCETFIEKLFTNCEIETIVQTRYLHFKGMLYESKNYLCDIICVQLWKALAQFRCGNTQLEVVLGAWKGMAYTQRLCQGCNLGKIEDEEHLLLVCPNTQKIRECFCSALPLTHTGTRAELMQITNIVALAMALLLSSCRLRTQSPQPRLWHAASTRGQSVLHDLPFV